MWGRERDKDMISNKDETQSGKEMREISYKNVRLSWRNTHRSTHADSNRKT